jgi:hypothetical protein
MKYLSILCVYLFSVVAFGQEVAAPAIQPVADLSQNIEVQDFLSFLVQSMGGLKGASSLAIVAMIVQGLVMVMRLKFADKFVHGYKLLIVYGLSMVGGVLTLMSQGIDLQAALIHANSMAAYQVFFHQVIKQIAEKKNDTKAA